MIRRLYRFPSSERVALGSLMLWAASDRADDRLIAHWKLSSDARDSATGHHRAINHDGLHFRTRKVDEKATHR